MGDIKLPAVGDRVEILEYWEHGARNSSAEGSVFVTVVDQDGFWYNNNDDKRPWYLYCNGKSRDKWRRLPAEPVFKQELNGVWFDHRKDEAVFICAVCGCRPELFDRCHDVSGTRLCYRCYNTPGPTLQVGDRVPARDVLVMLGQLREGDWCMLDVLTDNAREFASGYFDLSQPVQVGKIRDEETIWLQQNNTTCSMRPENLVRHLPDSGEERYALRTAECIIASLPGSSKPCPRCNKYLWHDARQACAGCGVTAMELCAEKSQPVRSRSIKPGDRVPARDVPVGAVFTWGGAAANYTRIPGNRPGYVPCKWHSGSPHPHDERGHLVLAHERCLIVSLPDSPAGSEHRTDWQELLVREMVKRSAQPNPTRWPHADPADIPELESKLAAQVASGGLDCAAQRRLMVGAMKLVRDERERDKHLAHRRQVYREMRAFALTTDLPEEGHGIASLNLPKPLIAYKRSR